MKNAGAKQVSSEAVDELQETLATIALDISKRAILFAGDEARLKVNRQDVKKATEEFFRSMRLQRPRSL